MGPAAQADGPVLDPELAAEQRHLDTAYARLDVMRRAAERVAEGYTEVTRGGTHQARLEREAAEAYTRRRLASLDIGETPLCFGRLDLLPPEEGGEESEPFYIGRISVTDDDLTPLVIDWRAPVAEPFYRATAVEPMGVARRRHFQTQGRRLLGIDDEVFDADAAEASGFTVVGEGALLAALDQERTGRMRDIVATIQAEQDEAIRADLAGILVVAGGPGTGKTAVALHRAAYLLYTHRKRLASQGVLLVGPSSIFLRYIDEVLPSLGEDEVSLATPAALKPRLKVRGTEPEATAAVKGDIRMAKVIAAAMGDRERPMPRDVVVSLDGYVLRMRRRDSARIIERAHARRGTHNERRPFLVGMVFDHFKREYRRALVARVPRRSRPPRLRGAAARAHRRPLGGHGRRSHRRRRPGARRVGSARVGGRPVEPGASPARRARRARSHVARPQWYRAGARSARVPCAHPLRIRGRAHRRGAGAAVPRTRSRRRRSRVDRRRSPARRRSRLAPRCEEPRSAARAPTRTPRLGARSCSPHGRVARRGCVHERGRRARALRLRLVAVEPRRRQRAAHVRSRAGRRGAGSRARCSGACSLAVAPRAP